MFVEIILLLWQRKQSVIDLEIILFLEKSNVLIIDIESNESRFGFAGDEAFQVIYHKFKMKS